MRTQLFGSTLDRYLLREAGAAWAGVTFVLLAVMLSTRFARFLAEAASGDLPQEFLLKVVALSSLQYLVVLIPISLLLATMMSLGRLYKDSEIAAMTGCGVGPWALYRPFLILALLLSVFTSWLAFDIGPWAGRSADKLRRDAHRWVQYTPFESGRFKEAADGKGVFYTARLDEAAQTMDTVFAQISEPAGPSIITAASGKQSQDAVSGDRIVDLANGYRYFGTPGEAAFDVMHFDSLETHVPPPELIYEPSRRKIEETGTLLASSDRRDRAEIHWRLSAPISVLLLTLIAIPLAYLSPREGRYGRLVYGLGAYLVYSNLLAAGQTWMAAGKTPTGLGLWWVHALTAIAAAWLIARRLGWAPRLRAARVPA